MDVRALQKLYFFIYSFWGTVLACLEPDPIRVRITGFNCSAPLFWAGLDQFLRVPLPSFPPPPSSASMAEMWWVIIYSSGWLPSNGSGGPGLRASHLCCWCNERPDQVFKIAHNSFIWLVKSSEKLGAKIYKEVTSDLKREIQNLSKEMWVPARLIPKEISLNRF